jgi:hypothetical protein
MTSNAIKAKESPALAARRVRRNRRGGREGGGCAEMSGSFVSINAAAFLAHVFLLPIRVGRSTAPDRASRLRWESALRDHPCF